MTTAALPLVRVFRGRRGETFDEARLRRAEIVTLDPSDLRTIVTRCQTSFSRSEAEALSALAGSLARGAAFDILLSPGSRLALEKR